jgi:hypothetical protein
MTVLDPPVAVGAGLLKQRFPYIMSVEQGGGRRPGLALQAYRC